MTPQQTHNWFTKRGFVRSMYQLCGLLLLLFFVSWLYNGAANRRYVQRVYIPADAQYDIVAFGDSLIEGLGASEGRGFISIISEDLGIPILNAGKRRDTTAQALERLDTDVLLYQPKLVIISLGGNDVLRRVPFDERVTNLQTIIRRITATGARVIVLAPQTDLWGDNYQEAVAELALSEGATYVPNILEGILYNPKYLFDIVHPNNRGHALIAERVEPIVRSVWNEIQAAEREQLEKNRE